MTRLFRTSVRALLQAHGIAHSLRTKISRLGYASSQTELITLDTDNEAAVQHAQQMYQAWSTMSRNRHFPDQAHANTYVGHEEQLKKIEDALDQVTSVLPMQKRFVIQGQPDSGKTELALRYAIEHKAHYWGVFWVDASSRDTAEQSYITLAKEFGENLTEQAAKQFLSSRELIHPWLLIIDNADDHDLSLEELSPTGDKGSMFVTTRNQEHIGYGNAGRIAPDDRRGTTANRGHPRLLYMLGRRSTTKGFGYPNKLSIVTRKRCEYVKPGQNIGAGKAQQPSERGSQADLYGHENMSVYATFDLMLEQLKATARDKKYVSNALQLLQMFSFTHFDNIHPDMPLQASINPLHEKNVQNEIESRENEIINGLGLQTESTQPWLKSKIRDLVSNCFLPALLPELLKNANNLISDQLIPKVLPRLRNALRFLASRSLINKITSEKEDAIDDDRPLLERYKMHPLVHKWVRDRPGLKVSEQAMYCQMASSVLASCIPLAGGDSDHDITLRREMKPHIEEVRKCSGSIQAVTREANSKRQNKA
ncbi:tetratricopeptide repeat domain-containing protein [Apiospora arundinis]